MTLEELAEISETVVERNRHLLDEGEDYWVFQRISRGSNYPDGPGAPSGPTVIVECIPLPLAKRAHLFRDGIDIVVPSVRRTPPESLSPNAKMQNYLNLIVAGFDAENAGDRAWPVLLDTRGFLAEGSGSNLFIVRNGEVITPKAQYVLAGISREVTIDLCGREGITCREEDIAPYDVTTADEAFLTSTSLCICPAVTFNGSTFAAAGVPGPVTERLMEAYAQEVNYDFVGQYLQHLDA